MATLVTKVRLYLEANGKNPDVEIGREGANVYLVNETGTDEIKTWNVSGLAEPTESQLNSYESAADTHEANSVIRRKRKKEYPHVREQLDMLYHDMVADKGDKTGEWFKAVKKVKDDNPKGD